VQSTLQYSNHVTNGKLVAFVCACAHTLLFCCGQWYFKSTLWG